MKPIEGIFLQEVKWYCCSRAEKYFLTFADALAMFAAFWLAGKWTIDAVDLNSFGLDSSRVLSYSLPLLLVQSFNNATAEAVRRSMAVDPTAANYCGLV